jgi:hypothetical protein
MPWRANACASTKAGLVARDPRHPVFANLETRSATALGPRMPTSSELRSAMNSAATPARTGQSRRCLRIARL